MRALCWLTCSLLFFSCLLVSCGGGNSNGPFRFEPVRGENPGEVVVFVTNTMPDVTLEDCRLAISEDDGKGLLFSTRMKPGETARTGVTTGVGSKVYYWCEGQKRVAYTIPVDIPDSIDESQFQWAELPVLE